MSLIESMKVAAAQLQEATRLAQDWRVRNAVADAGTLVECAIFIQEKIVAGRMQVETRAPGCPGPKGAGPGG
jgi:hypothetical protein